MTEQFHPKFKKLKRAWSAHMEDISMLSSWDYGKSLYLMLSFAMNQKLLYRLKVYSK